jgi:hypothetical protein
MTAAERIESAVEALQTRLQNVPSDALYQAPSDGQWPVMSTLAHVVEMLPYWAAQCAQIAASPGAKFGRTHDDPGRLEAIAKHAADPASVVSDALRASVSEALATLRPLGDWSLAGQHVRRGEMTIQQVVDEFMVGHVEGHVRQVDEALNALGYSPSQVP